MRGRSRGARQSYDTPRYRYGGNNDGISYQKNINNRDVIDRERRANNLCFYCGKQGHYIRNCQMRRQNNEKETGEYRDRQASYARQANESTAPTAPPFGPGPGLM